MAPRVLNPGSACRRLGHRSFSCGALCRSRPQLQSFPRMHSICSQCWKPKGKRWGWDFTLSFKKTSIDRHQSQGRISLRSAQSQMQHLCVFPWPSRWHRLSSFGFLCLYSSSELTSGRRLGSWQDSSCLLPFSQEAQPCRSYNPIASTVIFQCFQFSGW